MPHSSSPHPRLSNQHQHCRDIFGVTLLAAAHPAVRRLKRRHPTRLHGNKLWAASYLLMDYLRQHPPTPSSRVLEVGCGWGLAGILCAQQLNCQVTATDADAGVFPFLQLQADTNQVAITTRQRTFEQITQQELAGFDTLIAADICFWDNMVEPVFNLVARACAAGVGRIVIADPERPPFFELAERCAADFYAEIEEWTVDNPRRARGAILLIENR